MLIGPVQDGSLGTVPDGVEALGRMRYDEIGEHLASARVGLAILADTPKYRRNIPSKLFDYMAAGAPFVTSDFPNIRDATDSEGGLFVTPDSVDEIALAIVSVLTDDERADALQRQGLDAARSCFNFEAESERLVSALRDAMGE